MMAPLTINRYRSYPDRSYRKHRSKDMCNSPNPPKLILVAGPYRSNTDDDPLLMHANYRRMNEVALEIFRMGHLPLTGEAIALPLIEVAGSQTIGDAVWNEIFHPVGQRLVAQVDAVLRIGGPSIGADEMVSLARSTGKPVYLSTAEIGSATTWQSDEKQ
jgi:hypothetical protein